jgi:hypothetical protein
MSDPVEPEARLARGLRIDLLIGVCALFVSSLATAASLWQSHLISQQLASQVWPFVSIATSYNPAPGKFNLTISNEGLGPAQIRSIVVRVDGSVVRTFDGVLGRLAPHGKLSYAGNLANIAAGEVIRVGGSVAIADITSRNVARLVARGYRRISIHVCYCAIIPGNCWMIERGGAAQGTDDPVSVGTCPDETRDMFEAGTPGA